MYYGDKMIEELTQQLDILCQQIMQLEQSKMKQKQHHQKYSQPQEPVVKIAR